MVCGLNCGNEKSCLPGISCLLFCVVLFVSAIVNESERAHVLHVFDYEGQVFYCRQKLKYFSKVAK